MTPWSVAVWALLPALAVPVAIGLYAEMATRFVAVQLATCLTTLLLIIMSFAFDQDSYVDLALALTFLTLPGTLVMALFLERWL